MKRLAVFDWNGTLFDDLEANVIGANQTLALFGAAPIDAATYQERFTFPILHFYVACGIPASDYLAQHEAAADAFLETYEREALNCRLREGTIELLQWLRENNVHCMILSNHLRENVELQLKRFGLTHLFDGISCNEQRDAAMISVLNKQERLRAYIEDHHFDLGQSFIIGDSFEEPELAKDFGMTGFNITGGCLATERLAAKNPHHIVDTLGEVRNILDGLWAITAENTCQSRSA